MGFLAARGLITDLMGEESAQDLLHGVDARALGRENSKRAPTFPYTFPSKRVLKKDRNP